MVTSGKLAKGPRPPSLCPHGAHRPWLKIVQFLCSAALPSPALRAAGRCPYHQLRPRAEGIHPTIQPPQTGSCSRQCWWG